MAAKFKLVPAGTFKHTIEIPMAGTDELQKLQFTFKRLNTDQLKEVQKEFEAQMAELEEKYKNTTLSATERDILLRPMMIDYIMKVAENWELTEEFAPENLTVLLVNYPRAFEAISIQYQRELWSIRQKS